MASIVNYNDGLKRIDFSLTPKGPRKILRLGGVNAKTAGTWKPMVETIIADKLANRPHDAEISKWLGGLDEAMLAKLRVVGLADGVGLAQTTLGEFMDRQEAAMTGKPATRTSYSHTHRNLMEHFGEGRLLRDIRNEDADGWRTRLVEHEKRSPATVARRVIAARTIWRKAIRWKLAGENPFSGIKAAHPCNDSRKVFVPRVVIDKLIAEAPNTEWKVLIALSRHGGLRCPSEHDALRWGDIDFHRSTIRVTCPKLEHIEACAHRTIPLFPELREHLLTLFGEAPEGAEHVITNHRLGCLNLRHQFPPQATAIPVESHFLSVYP